MTNRNSKEDFNQRILVSITGFKDKHWRDKLKEVKKFNLVKVALFLEQFKKPQRKEIYQALLKSEIKNIPLTHIRHDMEKWELVFLKENFYCRYFTIHEDGFKYLKKWRGFYKELFLEMNFDNAVAESVKVKKIGGFCVDLSHFKAAEEKHSKEFEYVFQKRNISRLFGCNHLNGYSYRKNEDIHFVKSLKDFDYLKTLPRFLFGKVIAIETYNSIAEQLKYKKYLIGFLAKKSK